jgi:hypothetical protein
LRFSNPASPTFSGGDSAGERLPLDPSTPQAEPDVLGDRQVREEGVALEDRVHVPLVRRQSDHVAVSEEDPALGGGLETADHPQRGGLAAPRRPEHGEERPARDFQREIVDRDHAVEPLGHVLDPDVRGLRALGWCRHLRAPQRSISRASPSRA